MGLRINTNAAALTALRNLRTSDKNLGTSLERLSTGLRINRASDDPAGLVISEQLRSQIQSMEQALENTQSGANMIGTAEAALNEVSSLLIGLRDSAVFALNTAGASQEQVVAEQASVNAALQAIDRIAGSTRFGSTNLLDGSSAFKQGNTATTATITNLNINSVQLDGYSSRTFQVKVTTSAARANFDSNRNGGQTVVTGGNALYLISGNLGTRNIEVAANTTATQFLQQVNTLSTDTGVYALLDGGNNLLLRSLEYGNDQYLSIQQTGGTGTSQISLSAQTKGVDAVGTVNSIAFTAKGRSVEFNTAALNAAFTVPGDALITAGSNTRFSVRSDSGLKFQLNTQPNVNDSLQIGIRSISTSLLGQDSYSVSIGGGNSMTIGGKLSTLAAGGTNDLETDAGNALRIIDQASSQVSELRAKLGAIQKNVLDSNVRSLGIGIENLTASESAIRELDFAAETAQFTKNQILFQASTSVLASANLIPQTVLSLLQ